MKFYWAGAFYKPDNRDKSYSEPYITQVCNALWLLGLADGSETGWDLSYKIAHETLTFIANDISNNKSSLETAFSQAQKYLADTYPLDPDELCIASCSLIVGKLQGNKLQMAWLGREEAYLIRGKQVIQRTLGHTIANLHPDIEFPEPMAYHCLRCISADQANPEISSESWIIEEGDTLVFLTPKLYNLITNEQLIKHVTNITPEHAAKTILNIRSQQERRFGDAVLVIQF